jgi:hypothetical protein
MQDPIKCPQSWMFQKWNNKGPTCRAHQTKAPTSGIPLRYHLRHHSSTRKLRVDNAACSDRYPYDLTEGM